MQQGFPVNALNAIKQCPKVYRIYCATANPVQLFFALAGELPVTAQVPLLLLWS